MNKPCPTCGHVDFEWRPVDIDGENPRNIPRLLNAVDAAGSDHGILVEGLCDEAKTALHAAGHHLQYILLETGYGIMGKAVSDAYRARRKAKAEAATA